MQLPNTRISDKLFLFLAVGAALFALAMHVGIAQTNLPKDAWKIAAKHIRTHYQKGDAIGLLPPWALRGAQPLKDLPILFPEHLEKEDLSRYKRLWVVAAPRLGKWWFQDAFKTTIKTLRLRYWLQHKYVFARAKGSSSKQFVLRKDHKGFNRLEVYLFRLPPARPLLYDFLNKSKLRRAEVTLESPPPSQRFGRCRGVQSGSEWLTHWQPQPGWFMGRGAYFFGKIIQEIGNTPRDCLYAQPKRCKVLKIRFRNVPLQGELQIGHGFTTPSPGKVTPPIRPGGADILLSVWAENRKLKTLRISEKQVWRDTLLDLASFKLPNKIGSIEFQVHTPGYQHNRVGYCFKAILRKR